MCGLAGIFNRDNSRVKEESIIGMIESLSHRGPDDSGVWINNNIALGHRRLSIRDLSSSGHQPMLDPSGDIVTIFNGEIYNYHNLRHELENIHGCVFRSNSDTEILVNGYLAWGEKIFHRLEGMFAVAIWDKRFERLVLSRDGIGIKPLYYREKAQNVIFASEIKALLRCEAVDANLDINSFNTYLAAGYPGPSKSLIKNINQIDPGTYLIVDKIGVKSCRFWNTSRIGKINSMNEATEEFIEILEKVIRDEVASDVPLSVFQSGGIDSSIISMICYKIGIKPPLITARFSENSYDETKLSERISELLQAEKIQINIDIDSNPRETFESFVYFSDGHCADTGALSFYRLCREARKYTKVVLSGDGGDEFFGGYTTYAASNYALSMRWIMPSRIWEIIGKITYLRDGKNIKRLPMMKLFSRFALGLSEGGVDCHMYWRKLIPQFIINELYSKRMQEYAYDRALADYINSAPDNMSNDIDRWLLSDQRFHLGSILSKVDLLSMAHGLEIRVPLLNKNILEFSSLCSKELLYNKTGKTKPLLRSALSRLGAPKCVVNGKKKGFNAPLSYMLRNDLFEVADYWFDKNPDVMASLLKADTVRTLWKQHASQEVDHGFALWPLLILFQWVGCASINCKI